MEFWPDLIYKLNLDSAWTDFIIASVGLVAYLVGKYRGRRLRIFRGLDP